MNYETRIGKIKALLEKHNDALTGDHKNRVDAPGLLSALTDGAPTEETLAQLRFDDEELSGVPVRLARAIVAIATASAATAGTPPPAALPEPSTLAQTIVVRRAEEENEGASDGELIGRLDLENPGGVGRELDVRAKAQAFLIVVDGKIDVEASAARLAALRKGRPVTPTAMVGGVPIRPLRVGEPLREEPLAENPLYPGEALAEGDVCLRTNASWQGVPYERRALLHVAVLAGECRVEHPEIARALIEVAQGHDALARLSQRYPNAAVALREMPERSRPSLQIDPVQVRAEEARRGRPFVLASWKAETACRTILLAAPGDPNPARLDVHLAGRKKRGQIETWIAGQRAGVEAEVELMHRIQGADLVLLFLSPMFVATIAESAAVETIEARMRAGRLRVVPILSEAVALSNPREEGAAYWFERLERLPREGRALSSATDRDSVLAEMVPEVGRAAERLPAARLGCSLAASAVLLTHDEVLRLHAAAVREGLARSRESLLGGIAHGIAAMLPRADNPREQLLSDIRELGSRAWKGGPPILTWLDNAMALIGGRSEVAVFMEMAETVKGKTR